MTTQPPTILQSLIAERWLGSAAGAPLHSAINGSPDPTAAQKLAGDFQQIGTWIATNCH